MTQIKHLLFLILISFCILVPLTAMAQNRPQIKYAEEEVQRPVTFNQHKRLACGTQQNPIRVGGFVTNPPFGWVDIIPGAGTVPDGYINDGLSYQLFVELATSLGLKTKNVGFKSYYDAVTALKKGEIDVLLSSYYDKRTLGVGTSLMFPGYFSNPVIVVFVKGRERPVTKWEDLNGLKGIVRQEEMLYSLFYKALPDTVKVEQVSGSRKAYSALLKGQADFMITSLYAAEAESRRFKIIENLVLTQTPLLQPEMFFVFGSNSKCMPLKKMFADQLTRKKETSGAVNDLLFKQMDRWVERFRYSPPLTNELNGAAIDTTKEMLEPLIPEE